MARTTRTNEVRIDPQDDPERLADGVRAQPMPSAQRRGFRWIFGGILALAVLLGVGLAVVPLLSGPDVPAEAVPSSQAGATAGQAAGQDGMTASPVQAAIGETVSLTAANLPPNSGVQLLGGLSPEDMRPLGDGQTNADGQLQATAMVPDWADRGQPFHFAVEVAGNRLAATSVQVIVHGAGAVQQ